MSISAKNRNEFTVIMIFLQFFSIEFIIKIRSNERMVSKILPVRKLIKRRNSG